MDKEYILDLIKKSDEFNHMYTHEGEDFVIDATTKEQFLAFKDFVKSKSHPHYIYVAYWM